MTLTTRQYPWSGASASNLLDRPTTGYGEIGGACLVAAVLLTLVLWLVPALPGYAVTEQSDQIQVAFTFLSAAGLMVILAAVKTVALWRASRGNRKALLLFSIFCALTVMLIVFLEMVVQLLSNRAFYQSMPEVPANSAFLLLGAAALSLTILFKIVLKIRQPKSNPHA